MSTNCRALKRLPLSTVPSLNLSPRDAARVDLDLRGSAFPFRFMHTVKFSEGPFSLILRAGWPGAFCSAIRDDVNIQLSSYRWHAMPLLRFVEMRTSCDNI